MKKLSMICSVSLLGIGFLTNAYADKKKTTDSATVASDSWYSQSKAQLRVLNKLESTATVLTVPVGGNIIYKTLIIHVDRCIIRPPSVSKDSAAFLKITDTKLPNYSFSAWMFSEEPAVSVFEHPLYNVSMVGCEGAVNKQPLVGKPVTTSNVDNKDKSSSSNPSDLEHSLEKSINSQH